jgi:hypothetical protein
MLRSPLGAHLLDIAADFPDPTFGIRVSGCCILSIEPDRRSVHPNPRMPLSRDQFHLLARVHADDCVARWRKHLSLWILAFPASRLGLSRHAHGRIGHRRLGLRTAWRESIFEAPTLVVLGFSHDVSGRDHRFVRIPIMDRFDSIRFPPGHTEWSLVIDRPML